MQAQVQSAFEVSVGRSVSVCPSSHPVRCFEINPGIQDVGFAQLLPFTLVVQTHAQVPVCAGKTSVNPPLQNWPKIHIMWPMCPFLWPKNLHKGTQHQHTVSILCVKLLSMEDTGVAATGHQKKQNPVFK